MERLGALMMTDQKRAAGEQLATVGAVLLFLFAVPFVSLLVLSLVSGAYTVGAFLGAFFVMLQILLWWIGLLAGAMCFRFRRVILGRRRP